MFTPILSLHKPYISLRLHKNFQILFFGLYSVILKSLVTCSSGKSMDLCLLLILLVKVSLTRSAINLKGTGSRNRKQSCYLYNLYCCPHLAIVFCTDSGGWAESTAKLLSKIHQYLCNRTTYECFVCFSSKLKSPSSK